MDAPSEKLISNITSQKLHRLNRFWWVGVIIILLLGMIGFFIYSGQVQKNKDVEKERQKQEQIEKERSNENQGFKYVEPRMTEDQLAKANVFLNNGISIDDPENDFVIPPVGVDADGKSDNPKGYQLGWNDIKRVTFGADQGNFYVRFDMYGIIPNTMVSINGDDIKGIGGNIALTKFTTTNGEINEGMWQVGIMFTEQRSKDSKDESAGYDVITPRMAVTSIASPTTEIDKHGETVYAQASDKGIVSGGVGTDYVIAAFPLSNLNVAPGSEISFDISVETGSRVFHHASIDPLLDFGSAKSGEVITYKLGGSAYTSVKPDYK